MMQKKMGAVKSPLRVGKRMCGAKNAKGAKKEFVSLRRLRHLRATFSKLETCHLKPETAVNESHR
jgi:hypothetical protein